MEKIIEGIELIDKLLRVMDDGSLRIVETGKFIPKDGDSHWSIDSFGNIRHCTIPNNWKIKHSILFRTEEECKEYKEFLELLDEYSSEFVRGGANYCLAIDCDGRVMVWFRKEDQCEGTHFDNREKAHKFINKVGEDKIKKFMFDIWD